MPFVVESIAFNWNNAAATTDAMNIRRNRTTTITVPEYDRAAGRNEPSAYAAGAIGANVVQIEVTFSGGTPNATVAISANGNGSALGDVAATNVTFNGTGDAAGVRMNLSGVFNNATVGIANTTWTWQENGVNAGPVTNHTSYIVLALPQAPWVQTVGDANLPWSEALAYACAWATAAGDGAAIATGLTRGLNGFGPTYTGGSQYWQAGPTLNLTNFLAALDLVVAIGYAMTVNCSDCAAAVTTLGRLLGIAYPAGRIVPTTPPLAPSLRTRPILSIGAAALSSRNWNYHEIVWDLYIAGGNVWDASAQLRIAGANVLATGLRYDNAYEPALVLSGTPALPGRQSYQIV